MQITEEILRGIIESNLRGKYKDVTYQLLCITTGDKCSQHFGVKLGNFTTEGLPCITGIKKDVDDWCKNHNEKFWYQMFNFVVGNVFTEFSDWFISMIIFVD